MTKVLFIVSSLFAYKYYVHSYQLFSYLEASYSKLNRILLIYVANLHSKLSFSVLIYV